MAPAISGRDGHDGAFGRQGATDAVGAVPVSDALDPAHPVASRRLAASFGRRWSVVSGLGGDATRKAPEVVAHESAVQGPGASNLGLHLPWEEGLAKRRQVVGASEEEDAICDLGRDAICDQALSRIIPPANLRCASQCRRLLCRGAALVYAGEDGGESSTNASRQGAARGPTVTPWWTLVRRPDFVADAKPEVVCRVAIAAGETTARLGSADLKPFRVALYRDSPELVVQLQALCSAKGLEFSVADSENFWVLVSLGRAVASSPGSLDAESERLNAPIRIISDVDLYELRDGCDVRLARGKQVAQASVASLEECSRRALGGGSARPEGGCPELASSAGTSNQAFSATRALEGWLDSILCNAQAPGPMGDWFSREVISSGGLGSLCRVLEGLHRSSRSSGAGSEALMKLCPTVLAALVSLCRLSEAWAWFQANLAVVTEDVLECLIATMLNRCTSESGSSSGSADGPSSSPSSRGKSAPRQVNFDFRTTKLAGSLLCQLLRGPADWSGRLGARVNSVLCRRVAEEYSNYSAAPQSTHGPTSLYMDGDCEEEEAEDDDHPELAVANRKTYYHLLSDLHSEDHLYAGSMTVFLLLVALGPEVREQVEWCLHLKVGKKRAARLIAACQLSAADRDSLLIQLLLGGWTRAESAHPISQAGSGVDRCQPPWVADKGALSGERASGHCQGRSSSTEGRAKVDGKAGEPLSVASPARLCENPNPNEDAESRAQVQARQLQLELAETRKNYDELKEVLRKQDTRRRRIEADLRRMHQATCKMAEMIDLEHEVLNENLSAIVRYGWDSIQWKGGYTCLHFSAECRDDSDALELLALLCKDLNQRDDDGRRPLDYARKRRNRKHVEVSWSSSTAAVFYQPSSRRTGC